MTTGAIEVGPWRELLDVSPMAVVVHDHRGQVVHANRSFAQLLGYSLDAVLRMSASDLIHPDERAERDRLAARLGSGEVDGAVADRRLVDSAGRTVWVRAFKSAVSVGEHRLVMVAVQDMGEWRSRLDELGYAATHDELTGLLNRSGLTKEVDRIMAEGRPGRLAVIDLNGLKSVNDAHGHAAGDLVLRATADQLNSVRTRSWLVGRLGGDEFVVVDWAATGELRPILELSLATDIELGPGLTTTLSASIGEATFGAGAILDEVLHAADREMYRHKRARALAGGVVPVQTRADVDDWDTISLPMVRESY